MQPGRSPLYSCTEKTCICKDALILGNTFLHEDNCLPQYVPVHLCAKGGDPLRPKVILRFNFLNLPRAFPQTHAETIKRNPGKVKKAAAGAISVQAHVKSVSFDQRV